MKSRLLAGTPPGARVGARSGRRTRLPALAVAGAAVLLLHPTEGRTAAFHRDGVAACASCHVMHNSRDGMPPNPAPGQFLLLFPTASDLCLSCHARANGEVFGADPLSPPPERGAGNFVFLLEDNLNDGPNGLQNPIGGHHAGHNVVAPGWGLSADPEHIVAPGGTFPSSGLGCTSCHDPHGNRNHRMLWGAGEVPANDWVFTSPAPYGGEIPLEETEGRALHSGYLQGWTEWCSNCHTNSNEHRAFGWEHPVRETLGSSERANYNGYDGPQNTGGGQYATAYLPETPIQDLRNTTTNTTGAGASSWVVCISCHRAHATSAPAALRWDPNVTRLSQDGAVSGSYPIPDPYQHPEQRALCVKCHWSDAKDHGLGSACMSCHRDHDKKGLRGGR